MSLIPCLSWVPYLWGQVCTLFVQNATVDLPYEIIADILSRLPAEVVFLCGHACKPLLALTTASSFVSVHLNRATPVIAYQYFSLKTYCGSGAKYSAREVNIHLIDEVTSKKIVNKSIKIDIVNARPNCISQPYLFGSYNGFLLFRNFCFDSTLVVWNPITHEQVTVVAPDAGYGVRGLFFHPTANEYRVLFLSFRGGCYQYFILGLTTKSSRKIKSYSHPPSSLRNPVILNDVLHWMVCDQSYKKAYGVNPHCSESILLFNIHSEEFSTISHPGGQCLRRNRLRAKHLAMKLMENDGLLGLCDASSYKEIVIWILEDYEDKVWVKRHVIIEPLKMFRGVQCDGELDMTVKALNVYKDGILLSVVCKHIFLYNMQLGTVTRVGNKCKYPNLLVSALCHVNSLASLHTDNVVFLHNL